MSPAFAPRPPTGALPLAFRPPDPMLCPPSKFLATPLNGYTHFSGVPDLTVLYATSPEVDFSCKSKMEAAKPEILFSQRMSYQRNSNGYTHVFAGARLNCCILILTFSVSCMYLKSMKRGPSGDITGFPIMLNDII